jgi:hypothetical protein
MKCPSLLLAQMLAIFSLLSTSYLVATDHCRKKLIGRPFVIVVLIAAAALLLRLPFTSPRFYGLEYEDSYVYVSAARFIALHGHVADFHNLSPRGFHHHSPTPGSQF